MLNAKNIKEQSRKVANLNRNKRKLKRKENREVDVINQKYIYFVDEFTRVMFSVDWDEPGSFEIERDGEIIEVSIADFNPFTMFNELWQKYADKINNNRKIMTPVNKQAFYDAFIDNTKILKNDKRINFNNPQLRFNCWIV